MPIEKRSKSNSFVFCFWIKSFSHLVREIDDSHPARLYFILPNDVWRNQKPYHVISNVITLGSEVTTFPGIWIEMRRNSSVDRGVSLGCQVWIVGHHSP